MTTSCAENAAVLLHVFPPSPPQTTAPSSATNSSSERSGNGAEEIAVDGASSMQWEEF